MAKNTQAWGQNLPSFLRPIRGKRVGRYVSARVRREVAPIRREMRRQGLQLRGTQRAINRAYRGANQAIRGLGVSSQGAYNQAAQQHADTQQAMFRLVQDRLGQVAQQRQADAQARGGLDTSGQLLSDALKVASTNLASGSDMGAAMLNRGAAANQSFLAQVAANQGRRMQDLAKVRAQRADLRRDRRDLARQIGALRNEAIEDLRDRERDFYIKEKAFAQEAADRRARLQEAVIAADAAVERERIRNAGIRAKERREARQERREARQKKREERQARQARIQEGVEHLFNEWAKRRRDGQILSPGMLAQRRNRLIADLVATQNMSRPEAVRAVNRFIARMKRREANRGVGRPATGNTALPGVYNP